jgi:hypothetical protein
MSRALVTLALAALVTVIALGEKGSAGAAVSDRVAMTVWGAQNCNYGSTSGSTQVCGSACGLGQGYGDDTIPDSVNNGTINNQSTPKCSCGGGMKTVYKSCTGGP